MEEKENIAERLYNCLSWIMPLAKGYVRAHKVGNNQALIDRVNAVMSEYDNSRQVKPAKPQLPKRLPELANCPEQAHEANVVKTINALIDYAETINALIDHAADLSRRIEELEGGK